MSSKKLKVWRLVVLNKIFNLHFTDYCNYSCKCCYAVNDKKCLTLDQVKAVVDNISRYFSVNKITDGRINIAGGEPITCTYLQQIVDYIYSKDIKISIITNGSLLSTDFISANKNKISMIGISIDSLNYVSNIRLGRHCNYRTIDYDQLVEICRCVKENGIKLKINTVISKLNIEEDMHKLYRDINPDRVKFLQMLPTTDFAEKQKVSDDDFDLYLKKYNDIKYVSEKNENLEKAYMIIDSSGYLTTSNQHSDKRFNVLKNEINDIIVFIDFDFESEKKRYIA